MHTQIDAQFRDRPGAAEAESILRACVHCGFCNATCPTYLALGDERDGPRGRIYLIKELLAGADVTARTQRHLDRCLTCLSCETTCPSGVRYGRLADFARPILEQRVERGLGTRLLRWLLKHIVTRPALLTPLLGIGRLLRGTLPPGLRARIPAYQRPPAAPPARSHARTMLALAGCAQAAATPRTHAAAARVLDRLGISLVTARTAGCCGALSYHLGDHTHGKAFMRRNIDAWWPAIERGAEAIVATASGCGATIKQYGEILADDPAYAHKAKRVAALTRDLVEALGAEDLSPLAPSVPTAKIAVHCPCTLSHAQRLGGRVEALLGRLGFELRAVRDGHLCCGSAGTYSILQPGLSRRLRDDKIAALTADAPDQIVTANVGCQLHLAQATTLPVRHWIELLDDA